MGFLDALRGLPVRDSNRAFVIDRELAFLTTEDDAVSAGPADVAAPVEINGYDRVQWRKKLRRILSQLPGSEPQWADFNQETYALGFETQEITTFYREDFTMLIRQIVSDQVVTTEEHRKLDLARSLLGIPDAEAEEILASIVAEAESFFGKKVDGA